MPNALPKIVFIHGNGGSTVEDNWFPWLKNELETRGFTVIAKTFPDNELARQEYWLPFLENELHADENTILVGHSSGAAAALRYAETHEIFGSILICASHTDLGEEGEKASGYFDKPWDWDSIAKNQNWIVQFASINDPYIPVEEARYVHKQLNTEYFEFTDRGHFGWDTKSKEFPELLQALMHQLKLNDK